MAVPDGPPRLDVTELVRATPVGEGAGCAEAPARYRFRASGNEPFWSVTVGKDTVVFEQPDEPRRIAAPLTRRDEGASRRVFQAETAGHVIRVALSPARCSDSMSGALYSFSAEVVFDGRSLSGCARAGDLGEAP
jgi:putative lipoprotein